MRDKRLRTHAAAFRGALWITFAALIAVVLAVTLQYIGTVSVLDTEARHMVRSEITGLTDRFQIGGLPELLRFVRARAQGNERHDYVYAVARGSSDIVAGDLARWPGEAAVNGWFTTSVDLGGDRNASQRIEAEVVQLSPDYRLLVGHLADGRARLRERFIETLAWSIGITALIGLGLGWWISRRALRFVERATDTGGRFLAGRLDERLPVTGSGDEFDRLAEMVNACFTEVERMIASLRAATDGLAHDLKTPITRIRARIELASIRDEGASPTILAETAQDLDAVLKLINGLLALARADALTSDAFCTTDLADIATEAVQLYEPMAEANGLRLTASSRVAKVDGMRSLLMHAAVNLIDNAVKYAAAGGTIEVATETRDGLAMLVVSDDGSGIPAGDRSRAVARLSRLDGSRSTPGSGLGLSIVAAVARAHGGKLDLEDNGPGLRAIITLPAHAKGARGRKA